MNKEEANAYGRGYQAGKKRTKKQDEKWLKIHNEIYDKNREMERQIYCAALMGLIATNKEWLSTDGKKVNNTEKYIEVAKAFVDKTPRRFK